MSRKFMQSVKDKARKTRAVAMEEDIKNWLTLHKEENLATKIEWLLENLPQGDSLEKKENINKIIRTYIGGAGLAFYFFARKRKFANEWDYLQDDWLTVRSDMNRVSSVVSRTISYLKDVKGEKSQ